MIPHGDAMEGLCRSQLAEKSGDCTGASDRNPERTMRTVCVGLLSLSFMIAPAAAQSTSTTQESQAIRRDWLLCQSGDVERCNRLLRLPLDDGTRVLVEVDLHQNRDRLGAQVRTLLQVCNDSGNVRACDRALRYNLPAADRREILELRKAVVNRTSQRASR
jgi:hypothetical protein